jgi:hypothetical protein
MANCFRDVEFGMSEGRSADVQENVEAVTVSVGQARFRLTPTSDLSVFVQLLLKEGGKIVLRPTSIDSVEITAIPDKPRALTPDVLANRRRALVLLTSLRTDNPDWFQYPYINIGGAQSQRAMEYRTWVREVDYAIEQSDTAQALTMLIVLLSDHMDWFDFSYLTSESYVRFGDYKVWINAAQKVTGVQVRSPKCPAAATLRYG